MKSRRTSKKLVTRGFVARMAAQHAAWQRAPLDGLDLVALLIDGVHLGDHCLIVALGIAADGQKHPLGLWAGSTETRPANAPRALLTAAAYRRRLTL